MNHEEMDSTLLLMGFEFGVVEFIGNQQSAEPVLVTKVKWEIEHLHVLAVINDHYKVRPKLGRYNSLTTAAKALFPSSDEQISYAMLTRQYAYTDYGRKHLIRDVRKFLDNNPDWNQG